MHQKIAKQIRFLFFSLLVILASCSSGSFHVQDVKFYGNCSAFTGQDTLELTSDLNNAVLEGIEFPTAKQTSNGFFNFSFLIKNTSRLPQRFYYKLYYQNESYKFPETHPYAHENFYGSWQDAELGFLPTLELLPGEESLVLDSFKILGNPRNEGSCFGMNPYALQVNSAYIEGKKNDIRSIPDWFEKVKQKANDKKIPVEDELYNNAIWLISEEIVREKAYNNRWKKNPRMGNYKIMLVVTSAKDIGKIPYPIQNITKKTESGNYTNPFGFFSSPKMDSLSETKLFFAPVLNVKTSFDLGSGIYQDVISTGRHKLSQEFYCASCGDSKSLYKEAQFAQYFHYVNKDFLLHNIPVTANVVEDNITRADYANWIKIYKDSSIRVANFVCTSDYPCKTVIPDKTKNSLSLVNPASPKGEFRKEHVGVNTRIGFSYGKFVAKIKFPKQLSKDNVWNGLTNAFWLLFQEEGEWNKRRICDADVGYLEKSLPDEEASLLKSKKSICYSEIDFELLKETPYWPKSSYNNNTVAYQSEDGTANKNIMVTCTNWDMACRMPKKFDFGARMYEVNGNKYLIHRWNHFYKALTAKIPVDHDELYKNDSYYFEIDWLPTKIVWKIGSEKNKMRTICEMTDEFTSIPNNQMKIVFTQEWHNQEWWPTAPFKQNFVPYPSKDLVGEILELEVQ
jgi:hypothetical protein